MRRLTISTYEFLKRFPDEDTARRHIAARRWGKQPCCPFCTGKTRIQSRKLVGYYRCLSCQKDFTVRTGTIFERSHVPLHKWLYAMYLLATARKGISSLQLSKEVGVTQKTAWFILQRLREACGNEGQRQILTGIVEADETYIGGKETNKHQRKKLNAGRGAVGKTAVLGLRQRGGALKARVIKQTDTKTIQSLVERSVRPGSALCTDEHAAYKGMRDYQHKVVNHSAKEFVNGMAHTNGVESVWAVLKRGYNGVYHSFSEKHLQRYVDEFAYRLNEGNVKWQSLKRINSLIKKTVGVRLTYKDLTRHR